VSRRDTPHDAVMSTAHRRYDHAMTPQAAAVDKRWNPLLRVAAVAALVSAVFIPIQTVVFIIWPPPLEGTVRDWFGLLQDKAASLVSKP